ncbi:MAG TPA: hypothetical protein VNZ26_21490, partial [Vicinamibacterales bacterium]|nr:hypothetical protein [Vicinamibacterales bacterium]
MLIKRSEWLARIALVMVTSVGITTAIWLIPASVHIVGWRANSAIRAALFAPWSRWWTAFAGVTAVAVFGELLRLRLGTALVRAGRMRFRLAPLLWLWLWVVPYLPWVPDRAPALLALAGPLRWVVAACAVLAALGPSIKAVSIKLVASFNPSSSAGTPPFAPRPRTIFAISLVIYLVLGFQFQSFYGLGGDEPHYLIITHSLLVDHDLDIANNHERRDFRAFFPGELRPDYLRRGQHGEIYSIHAPGLPALLLPGYALAGARGAVATMAFLGALTATAVFTLAALLSGELTALLVWAVVCLTIPFVPHAWMIYPELPGALIVAWATLWLWGRPPSRRELLLRGSVLAVLPWLHTKFVVLLVLFVAFEVVRLWFRGRRAHMTDVRLGLIKDIAIFLVPIAVS